jgi:transcriptional regulator with XRE-family HTH domain
MGRAPRPRPKRLGSKLKEIRERLDLTQAQMVKRLAEPKIKVRPGHISEYEDDSREPSLLVLLRYARLAGVIMDVLVDDKLDLPERLPAEPSEWIVVRQVPTNRK